MKMRVCFLVAPGHGLLRPASTLLLVLLLHFGHGLAVENCTSQNGDVNGDMTMDVPDAVALLGNLFLAEPELLPGFCARPGIKLAATGQFYSWPLCDRDDGFFRLGCPSEDRYVDNGDGTVTDRCTGLMWLQSTVDVNKDGRLNDQDLTPWCEALQYCEDLVFAGFDDWRLPNERELVSLSHFGLSTPAVDPLFTIGLQDHWSSTPNTLNPKKPVFVVSAHTGGFYAEKYEAAFFRAVRGLDAERCTSRNGDINADGKIDVSDAVTILLNLFVAGSAGLVPICGSDRGGVLATGQLASSSDGCPGQDAFYRIGCPPTGRFVDNGDGTVADLCTGLMWQMSTADTNSDGIIDDLDRMPQCEALEFCESLAFAGFEDWRLPNIRELESLVDYGRIDPAMDPVFTVSSQPLESWSAASYWSSTRYSGAKFAAEIVTFGGPYPSGGAIPAINRMFVRAVRGP